MSLAIEKKFFTKRVDKTLQAAIVAPSLTEFEKHMDNTPSWV